MKSFRDGKEFTINITHFITVVPCQTCAVINVLIPHLACKMSKHHIYIYFFNLFSEVAKAKNKRIWFGKQLMLLNTRVHMWRDNFQSDIWIHKHNDSLVLTVATASSNTLTHFSCCSSVTSSAIKTFIRAMSMRRARCSDLIHLSEKRILLIFLDKSEYDILCLLFTHNPIHTVERKGLERAKLTEYPDYPLNIALC